MEKKNYLYSIILDQNTPELRKSFEDLGYTEMVGTGLSYNPSKGNCIITCAETGEYAAISRGAIKFSSVGKVSLIKRIQCGVTEELALGVAALRGDTDFGQWFTDDLKGNWIKSDQKRFLVHPEGIYHKATINELEDKFPREGIQFLNSAYIGKVSKDIIELLEDVGYYNSRVIDGANKIQDWQEFSDCGICTSNHGSYSIIHRSAWESTNPHVTWNCAGRIDCGVDEVRFYQTITPRL